jgi:hypothetical protein
VADDPDMTPPSDSPLFERAQQFVDRRRLVLGLCAAVAIALIAAVPGILTSDSSGRRVQTAAESAQVSPTTAPVGVVSPLAPQQVNAPTDASPTPPTTRPALVLGTTYNRPAPTTPAKPAAKPAAPASQTPPPPPKGSPAPPSCHNSYDAACGAFRWDPDPGPNQPITGNVAASSQNVRVGDKVTFTVTGDDPDAAPLQECNVDFGDDSGYHCDPQPLVNPSYCPKQYGPWAPPAKQDGKLNTTYDHTYAKTGTYTIHFDVRSAMQECNNPYASAADLQVTIFVTP